METVTAETTRMAGVQVEHFYLADPQIIILDVRGLPERYDDEIYQVWLVEDGQPSPGGFFHDPATQAAISADIEQYEAVSITIEPGPLGSLEPTTEPVLISEFN